MPLQIGPRLKALLDEPRPITVGTTRRDGSVQMTPVWFEYRDGQIWLNGGPKRDWVKHTKRDPRVSLFVLDPDNMFRWAQIQGRLVDTSTEGADDHIEHLAQRYTGGPYRNPKVDRLIVRIAPSASPASNPGNPGTSPVRDQRTGRGSLRPIPRLPGLDAYLADPIDPRGDPSGEDRLKASQ